MSTQAYVEKLPKCDFCDESAEFDGRTIFASWANLCKKHFSQYGIGLGLGRGQKLIAKEEVMKFDTENHL